LERRRPAAVGVSAVASRRSGEDIEAHGGETPPLRNGSQACIAAVLPHRNALAMWTAIGDERPGKIFRGSAIEMDLGLTGKVAPATRASRGAGHGIALTLAQERTGKSAAEVHQRDDREINLIRLGAPDDIAGLFASMVSPRGCWLHGTTIDMDCGAGQAP
jgi:hypothetical protein